MSSAIRNSLRGLLYTRNTFSLKYVSGKNNNWCKNKENSAGVSSFYSFVKQSGKVEVNLECFGDFGCREFDFYTSNC